MFCSNQIVSDLLLVFLQDRIKRSVFSDASLETKLIFEVVDVEGEKKPTIIKQSGCD